MGNQSEEEEGPSRVWFPSLPSLSLSFKGKHGVFGFGRVDCGSGLYGRGRF